MKIDLRSILEGIREFQFFVESDWWLANGLDDVVLGLRTPMHVRVLASRPGKGYLLEGHLKGAIEVRCDRCLEPYAYDLEKDFRLVLVVQAKEKGQAEMMELFREDLDEAFIDDFVVDLSTIAREQIFLSLPMKSICSENCAGLCPACGGNLNKKPCGCKSAAGHPGFSKLKTLKLKGA